MARVDNLENFLTDVAGAIKTKKGTTDKIPAANFDTEIEGIETGIDTSDATATANDMVQGKTAYVNGKKIEGRLPEQEGDTFDAGLTSDITIGNIATDNYNSVDIQKLVKQDAVIRAGQNVKTEIVGSDLCKAIGLTADKLIKGTTILNGLKGTAETGGTTTEGVKLFETVEKMQADPDAKEGDKAIVYRKEIQNMTADMEVTAITFPETVTLPAAFTDSTYCRIRTIDSSVMFDGNCQLSKTSFRFDSWSDSGMIRVEYTSEDGITYTRTRFQGDSGDLTNPVEVPACKVEQQEEWNDNLGYFMQIGGMNFEGLYENVSYVSDIQIEALKGTSNQDTQDYELLEVSLPSLASKVMDLWSSGGQLLFTYNPATRLGKIVKSGMALALINYQNNTYAGIADSRNDRTYDTADINFDTMTISNIVTKTGYTGLTNVGPIGYSNYDGHLVFEYDATDLLFCVYVSDKNNIKFQTVLYTTDATGSLTTTSIVSGKKHDVMKNHYITAPTQLTLSNPNELLPGKIAYGKNGVVTGDGSIYDNLDTIKYLNERFGINILNNCAKLLYNRSNDYSKTHTSVEFEKGQYVITQEGIDNLILLEPVCQWSSDSAPSSMIFSDTLYALYFTGKVQVYNRQTNKLLNEITFTAKQCFTIQVNDNLAYFVVFSASGGQILVYKLTDEFTLVATKSTTSNTTFGEIKLVYNAPTNTIYFTYIYSGSNYIKCLRNDSFIDLASYTSVGTYTTWLADAGLYVYYIYRNSTSSNKSYNNVVIDVKTNKITTYTNNNYISGGVSAIDNEGNYYYMNSWSGGNGPLVKVTPTSASVISKYALCDSSGYITRWDYYDVANNKLMATNAYYMSSQITGATEYSDVWTNRFWDSNPTITINGQAITLSVRSNVTHSINLNARGYDKFVVTDDSHNQVYIASNIKSVELKKVENHNYVDIYNFLVKDMLFKLSNKKYEPTLSTTEYNTALKTSKKIEGVIE